MIRIKVFDRDTGKLFWQEDHELENANRMLVEMTEWFSPVYFRYEKEEVNYE